MDDLGDSREYVLPERLDDDDDDDDAYTYL